LNREQKEAVDAIEGPVMVIAGPGTGKTHLLTMRIANILDKTDALPESVLALTFTESGVSAMRKKLSSIIGSLAYRVEIYTFHGFCNKIIKDYPDEFLDITGSDNISDVEQIKLLKQILENTNLKHLKTFSDPCFFLWAVVSAISELKRQGFDYIAFKKLAEKKEAEFLKIKDLYYESGKYKEQMKGRYLKDQKYINRNKDLAVIYEKYQQELKKKKLYDYGDMVMRTAEVLQKNKELLLILQEQYQYILVDEHQDTNSAQNRILELLASYFESPNLFIVGDEKQAIFRFQGASKENFNYFKKLYKGVKVISLRSNYRSPQIILDAAFSVDSLGGKLKSESKRPEDPISLMVFDSTEEELFNLAEDILKHKDEKVAVLFRENKEALSIARVLEKKGVSFSIESDQDALEDEDIKKLLIILKAIQNFGSDKDFIFFLHLSFLNIPAIDIYEISRSPYKSAKEGRCSDAVKKAYNDLAEWKKSSMNENAPTIFEDIVRDSGFLGYLLSKPGSAEKIKKLHALFASLKNELARNKNYTLDDYFYHIDVLREQNIFLKSNHIPSQDKVRLMTIHKSKGLEFDIVYLINAISKQNIRRSYIKLPEEVLGAEEDEEKNLFYVALTRARKKLIISYSNQNTEGKAQYPASFLELIPEKYIKRESNLNKFELKEEFAPPPILKDAKEKSILNELFLKYGLSATALNNYLECPWKYFYRSLIRIPESPNKHLMFGTATHSALKSFFDKYSAGENPGAKNLIMFFEKSLNSQPLQKNEYDEILEKGTNALAGYHKEHSLGWKRNILSEYGVRGVELAKNIIIAGKIDKIEINDSANNVNVVDYKTGKPKTKNCIEGKTKDSDGNYKRQLIFYKLLLDGHGRYNVKTGEIDFIEPDQKGRYHKEAFDIKKEDADILKEEIIQISQEIINLDFWDKRCDDPDCQYCKMRALAR